MDEIKRLNYKKVLIENNHNLQFKDNNSPEYYLFEEVVDMHTIEHWERHLDKFGIKYALYDFSTKKGHEGYNLRLERPFENNFSLLH